MVCECGHNKDRHESGRDYGYHGWQCRGIIVDGKRKSCNCPYYRKQTKKKLESSNL